MRKPFIVIELENISIIKIKSILKLFLGSEYSKKVSEV
jgi:hypothetical protein